MEPGLNAQVSLKEDIYCWGRREDDKPVTRQLAVSLPSVPLLPSFLSDIAGSPRDLTSTLS